jgi:hypothetical protein
VEQGRQAVKRTDRLFTVIGYLLVLMTALYFGAHVGIAVLR